ncbi:hypothetical protein U3516DRAFT_159117 [Neocallimastix sp. 'constans']
MSLTAQLRSLNHRMHFHKELSSLKSNINKIKVDTKKNLGHRFIHKKGLHNSESRIPKGKNLLNGSGDEV